MSEIDRLIDEVYEEKKEKQSGYVTLATANVKENSRVGKESISQSVNLFGIFFQIIIHKIFGIVVPILSSDRGKGSGRSTHQTI